LIIGYDTRFFSDRYAMVTADVIRGNGIPVIISDRPISTPVLSYSVKSYNASGGIMITASHNPYYFNGIKYKSSYGGSAFPSITSEIETLIGKERPKVLVGIPSKEDLLPSYKKHISSLVDIEGSGTLVFLLSLILYTEPPVVFSRKSYQGNYVR